MPPRRRIAEHDGLNAVSAWRAGATDRHTLATATRFFLEELATRYEGNSVEVRVPPFGATQAIQGPGHTRGTPANVVEMDAASWLELATGVLSWDAAIAASRVLASGVRANLAKALPLYPPALNAADDRRE